MVRAELVAGDLGGGAPLPPADAVALAKGFAGRACALKAADAIWSDKDRAYAWIDRSRYVAFAVLVRLCPDVGEARVARCLGLDPFRCTARLHTMQAAGAWSPELVDTICRQILGGEQLNPTKPEGSPG